MFTEEYNDNNTVQELSPEYRAIWDMMFVCREEIKSILHQYPMLIKNDMWSNEADITVAAYLLVKAFDFDCPEKVAFEDLELYVDQEIIELAKSSRIVDAWDELIVLTKKYTYNYFNLNAILQVFNDYSNNTPNGIIEISKEILDVRPGEKVADLCCGTGSVSFEMHDSFPDASISGFDIDQDAIALAKIHNEIGDYGLSFRQMDVFNLVSENKDQFEKFDKLFANYPFGTRLNRLDLSKWYKDSLAKRIPSISKATSSDWLYNMLIVDLLSSKGKAIGIMTNGSTWNMIDTPIRKFFVENGLVECVIALPAKLFNNTNIATSLVVFSHGNKAVRLIDATAQFKAGRRRNELAEENIAYIINALKSDNENSVLVPVETLRENDYVLNISRYLHSGNAIMDGVPFGSVIKRITRGAPLNANQLDEIVSITPTDTQYLMLSNIQNGMIDDNLPYVIQIDKKLEKYCLTNHCLILSKNGYPYKVAVAEIHDGQKILANGNLYIIEVCEDKVDPYYLAAFFSSELGTASLKSITVGATIPNIGVDQLKKLLIPLPSLDIQKEISEKYQAAKDELAMLKLKTEMARNRMSHAFEEVE